MCNSIYNFFNGDSNSWLKVVGLQDLLKDYQMPDPLTGLILQILVEDKTKIPKYFKISNKSKELSLQFALYIHIHNLLEIY